MPCSHLRGWLGSVYKTIKYWSFQSSSLTSDLDDAMTNCSDAQAEVNWSHFAPSAPLHFTGHTPHSARHPQIIESRASIQQVMLIVDCGITGRYFYWFEVTPKSYGCDIISIQINILLTWTLFASKLLSPLSLWSWKTLFLSFWVEGEDGDDWTWLADMGWHRGLSSPGRGLYCHGAIVPGVVTSCDMWGGQPALRIQGDTNQSSSVQQNILSMSLEE